MIYSLALDPSLNAPGLALFRDQDLMRADRVRPPAWWSKLDRGDRAGQVAGLCLSWVRDVAADALLEISELTYEWPQVYQRGKSKGDPNDLLGLLAVAAELAGQLRVMVAAHGIRLEVEAPTPAEWIGNLPKTRTGDPWASPRGMRIRSRLTPAEVALVVPSHDAIDAAGLGLHRRKRLGIHRIFPGASPG